MVRLPPTVTEPCRATTAPQPSKRDGTEASHTDDGTNGTAPPCSMKAREPRLSLTTGIWIRFRLIIVITAFATIYFTLGKTLSGRPTL